ncbi:MAG: LPS assembly lipoprotein LptE [Aquabacterium sp.]
MRSPRSSTRRHWLTQATHLAMAATSSALLLGAGGCGFKLRHGYDMAFKTVQLTGFAGNSPLAAELARALEASGVRVVDSTLEATQAASAVSVPKSHVVLDGLEDKRDTLASAITAYGQVRNMTARIEMRFQVKRGDGTVLLAPTVVGLSRDMTYNEKDALAKQDESVALQRAMQSDIVNQVMRRLAAITPAQLVAPPAPPVPAAVHAASAP